MIDARIAAPLSSITALLLGTSSVLADCPVSIQHPTHIPFSVENNLTSDVNLSNQDADACGSNFVKQVPVFPDGSFGYGSQCAVTSYGDGYDEGQPMSWADADNSAGMSGRILESGFRIDVVLDGYLQAYNGSTSVDTELITAYRFVLEDDARFTCFSFFHIDGDDIDVKVELIDYHRATVTDLTEHYTEGEAESEPIAAGVYEIRTTITYQQDGCDNLMFIAASEVEMNFYCPESYRLGDLNKDDIINGKDLALLLSAFNTSKLRCRSQ